MADNRIALTTQCRCGRALYQIKGSKLAEPLCWECHCYGSRCRCASVRYTCPHCCAEVPAGGHSVRECAASAAVEQDVQVRQPYHNWPSVVPVLAAGPQPFIPTVLVPYPRATKWLATMSAARDHRAPGEPGEDWGTPVSEASRDFYSTTHECPDCKHSLFLQDVTDMTTLNARAGSTTLLLMRWDDDCWTLPLCSIIGCPCPCNDVADREYMASRAFEFYTYNTRAGFTHIQRGTLDPRVKP